MKEILLNIILNNIIMYKINLVKKYCIIYSKFYLTKINIKYFIKFIMKYNYYKCYKVNKITNNKLFKKYIIFFN
uniref:Large subunit ribosomal protein 23 n=1 Tax=Leucocytozoon caulleryi TaxID=211597 RepID=U3TRT5_LEUCU|nr:large subunit ribosomal protein 23 [Leucocytozoon caulleryi]BAN94668.1 large subunit ribosomal protein 23 [Leucocytozoon caulleryi]